MIHFRRASRALNRLFSKFDRFTLFSARFAQMISFSSLQIYNHCTFCGVLRAYFVNILHLNCKMCIFPHSISDFTLVAARRNGAGRGCQHFNFNTQLVPPLLAMGWRPWLQYTNPFSNSIFLCVFDFRLKLASEELTLSFQVTAFLFDITFDKKLFFILIHF